MTNLLALLRDSFGSESAERLSQALGLPLAETRSAIDAFLPALVGAFAQRSADEAGAERILRMLRSGTIERVAPDAGAARLIGVPDAIDRLATAGPGLIGALFGERAKALAGSVAAVSGLAPAGAARLLDLVVPLVAGAIKNIVVEERMDTARFRAVAAEQREVLQGAIDRRLLGALGFTSVAAYLDSVSRPVSAAAAAHAARARRWMPWLVVAIGFLVLAALALFL